MPSFRIRNWRVERFMPNRAAAPLGPAMTHCDCSRALRIWLRSVSPSVSRSVLAGLTGFAIAARAVWLEFSDRHFQDRTTRHDDAALDHVLQLADVAGPLIVHER